MAPRIRIAISGGGIAGASLLHALVQYPHLDVHIFESASVFKEAGVAFGIPRNGTAALRLMGTSSIQCLERAGGVPTKGSHMIVAQGKDTGRIVFEVKAHTTTVVQRAEFLRELLAHIPSERMHACKKLVRVEKLADSSVLIFFADGTTHACDILIGADGIHSTVRKIILGDTPAATPRNTGNWAIMTLRSYDEARASIGEAPVDITDAREYGWIGHGTLMLHNLLSHGQVVQFSIFGTDESAVGSDQWQRSISREEIRDTYIDRGWPPHLSKAVLELVCDQSEHQALYLWEHEHASTYVDGPLCIMGDAAHAMTPWQGSGSAMCMEDSLILSSLLAVADSPKAALEALKIYSRVRLPRSQRVVESSFGTGVLMTGRHEGIGLDGDRLENELRDRWNFIINFDNAKHRDEAVQMLKAALE